MESCFVLFAGLLAIGRADMPVHAPAAVAGAFIAEQIFERGPEVRCQWMNGERRVARAPHGLHQEMLSTCEFSEDVGADGGGYSFDVEGERAVGGESWGEAADDFAGALERLGRAQGSAIIEAFGGGE